MPLLEPDRTGHEPNAVAWASRDALRFDQNEKVRFDGKGGGRVCKTWKGGFWLFGGDLDRDARVFNRTSSSRTILRRILAPRRSSSRSP